MLMSQNVILTQALHYIINKKASLELKSHWNNFNMAFSIHMSHSFFFILFLSKMKMLHCFPTFQMNYTTTTIFLHKTIMVTQLQDIFCKIARSGEKMSLSTFICRNEECRKGFTNDTSWKKVWFFMHYCIFSCRLSPCLSLDAVYCMPVCLSVCLSVCVPFYAGVSFYERSIFDIPNRR